MRCTRFLSALVLALVCSLTGLSQYEAPSVQKPDKEILKAIEEKTDQLARKIAHLRTVGIQDVFLVQLEVFHRAAVMIVKHNEFFDKNAGQWTLDVLDRGLLRASQQERGESALQTVPTYSIPRGYRSIIDGSVQPYAVTYPLDYAKNPKKKWRVDVVLHGRNNGLTEVSFLHKYLSEKETPKDLNYVRLDIFGRGNNAYRWAGESDVYEALEHFVTVERGMNRFQFLDPARFVLRGFSMGGAGTWHLGLHRPDRWCVLGPGAGFTTTHGYVGKMPEKLPPYQEACLSIYDAVDYAENVAMIPVVAYSGSDDPQRKAAQNIEDRLKPLGLSMTHLVAPGLKHQFPPEWQKKAEAEYARHAAKGRPSYPNKVRFVTWTVRYSSCDWVEILALNSHYHLSRVEAETTDDGVTYNVKTTNIRALSLRLPGQATAEPVKVTIDDQKLTVRPLPGAGGSLYLYLERKAGQWRPFFLEKLVVERMRQPQKSVGLQGPIDDAFMVPFLCVRGTRDAWHSATDQYARANLERFQKEWSKYFRGELQIKDDVDVTSLDIASSHLILFGDPASNTIIEQVVDGLPLKWTRDSITWNGKQYPANQHVPVLIYPSPLNIDHYVVLNSGHTFHAADFQGTNALLYPRLGDHALLKCSANDKDPLDVTVVQAGLFDDYWKMQGEK